MIDQVIVRGPREGRTLLVGGGDYVTYKASSAETNGDFFCFEIQTVPGFGPPLHKHAYRELFYVLEGSYDFTMTGDDNASETVSAGAGTCVTMPPYMPHTFCNSSDQPARMFCLQQHATLEGFFEEFGVPVEGVAHASAGTVDAPDFAGMAAALERNGVTVVGRPESSR